MIADMHCHVVYGVDDGSKDWEMTKQMLQKAVENNVRILCCTSHAIPARGPFPWDTYLQHMQEMGEYINSEGLPLTLYTGCEIMYTEEAARMARRGELPTLGQSRYVLVEFMPITDWGQITVAAREFSNHGLKMVCAHVERYACLHEDMDRLYELHEDYGVICQMNASTILRSHGLFGDKFAKKALKAGLIDLAASDSHNVTERACNLKACYEMLRKDYGSEMASSLLEDMPQQILHR